MLTGPIAQQIGFFLVRILVPLWVFAGAAFKLYERTPSNLPSQFVATAKNLNIDLAVLLHVLIALEFLAVAVMVFVPKLARAMAAFMLTCFVLILLNELRRQADSCGCFGSINIHPGVMLGIDGALLAGVILFSVPKVPETVKTGRRITAAAVVTVLGLVASFGVLFTSYTGPADVISDTGGQDPAVQSDPCAQPPTQEPFPNFWYVRGEISDWVGQCWNRISLFKLIREWPKDIAKGEKLVVLYRRDCDHCEEMFRRDFTGKIKTPILAYHIPVETPTWSLPPDHTAQLYDLSGETDWIVETPLVVKLVDGRVDCAAEGQGFEPCLGVEPHDH